MFLLGSRCDRCRLQPISKPGAAVGLDDGLSGELQAQHGPGGHSYRRRSQEALHSSLQILTRKCPITLPFFVFKCPNYAELKLIWGTLEKLQKSSSFYLFIFFKFSFSFHLVLALGIFTQGEGEEKHSHYEISAFISATSRCVQTSEMTEWHHLTTAFW